MADEAKVGIKFIADGTSVTKTTDEFKKKFDELGKNKVKFTPEVDFNKTKVPPKLTLPKFDPGDLQKANSALGDLQKKLQAVSTSSSAAERINGIRDSVLGLQKFRFEQAAILKESPELRSAYSQVAGQVQIAAAEARRFAQAQAQAAAEARKLAAARPAPLRAADQQLDGFRDRLNKLNFAPNLGQAAKGYEDILVKLRAWENANQSLVASNSDLAARVQTFRQSATQGLTDIAQRFQSLAGVAGSVAATFAGVGTLFGGLAAGALTVAGTFEQLQARLISVTGSAAAAAEKFTFIQKVAIESPFDVRGLVQSATILEGFQQRAEDFLPVAGNLAAAMGKSLPEATLVFAKAASGSTEGFESLRNEYAIQTRDLLKFGAVQGAVAGQLSHAESATDRNREALIKLINLRYGDAMERQSKTLTGALSNVGDAGDSLAASWGSNLIPIATLGAKALTAMLNVANLVPAPLKALGIAGAVVVAGVSGLGAAAFGAVASVLLLQAALANTVVQLQAVGIRAPLASAGLQALSAGANRVAGSLTASRLAAVGFGVGLLSLASIAATAGLALADSWEKAAVQMGERVSKSANEFADSVQDFRRGIDGINAAGKTAGVSVSIVGNAADQLKQVADAMANLPAAAVVDSFHLMTTSAEELEKKLQKIKIAGANTANVLDVLIKARDDFNKPGNDLGGLIDNSGSQDRFGRIQSRLAEQGVQVANPDDLLQMIANLQKVQDINSVNLTITEGQKKAYNEIVKPLKEATTSSKQLGEFLNLSKQVGTTQALATSLELVNQKIRDNSQKTIIATDNIDALIAKLSDPKINDPENAPVKAGLEAQLTLIQQRTGILETQAAAAEKAAKAEVDAQERAFRRKKALGEANLTDELYFVQQRIKAVEQGTEEEVALQERAAQLKEQLRTDQLGRAKAALQKEAEAGKTAVQDAQAGLGDQTVLAALEGARAGVDRWAKENAALLQQFPELRAELEKLRNNNAVDTQKAKTQGLKDALTQTIQALDVSITEATGSQAKLAAVDGALAKLKAAQASGYGNIKELQTKITDLTKQHLTLEKEISREKQQQAITLGQADLQNMEAEGQILENLKSQGFQNEAAITANREQQHRKRLALIEQEKQAAIAAGASKVFAEQQASRQIEAEDKRYTLQKLQTMAERNGRELQNAQTVESAALSVLESEASVLEQRKDLGQDVERQITANLKQQLQERVNLIELERQAAITSGQDRVTAETAAQAKLAVLANQEKARMLKDLQDKQSIRSRVFGRNSPVYSDSSDGLGISFGDFRLGDLRKPSSLPTPKTKTPKLDGRMKPVQGGGSDSAGGGSGQGQGGSGGPGAQEARSLQTWQLTFNGVDLFGPQFRDAVLQIIKTAGAEARNRAS